MECPKCGSGRLKQWPSKRRVMSCFDCWSTFVLKKETVDLLTETCSSKCGRPSEITDNDKDLYRLG